MIEVSKYIDQIIEGGSIEHMHKLKEVLIEAIEESDDCFEYSIDIYKIKNGSHFNKETLIKALDCIGGMKKTCEELSQMANTYGVKIPKEITIEDFSYAFHMYLSDYGQLAQSDDFVCKWSVAYCCDEDYPIKYGKCFDEWAHKMWLKYN